MFMKTILKNINTRSNTLVVLNSSGGSDANSSIASLHGCTAEY